MVFADHARFLVAEGPHRSWTGRAQFQRMEHLRNEAEGAQTRRGLRAGRNAPDAVAVLHLGPLERSAFGFGGENSLRLDEGGTDAARTLARTIENSCCTRHSKAFNILPVAFPLRRPVHISSPIIRT